jgi:DNA-binding Lrp family transcriptional regulator
MKQKGDVAGKTGAILDEMDRMILNEIQSSFPIEARPFEVLGRRLGCSEAEVMRRVERLKKIQVIRRIGANFNSRKLGYTSTLCAAAVPPDKMERFVELVNNQAGVTHNYRRDHEYNVWFTIIASSPAELERTLEQLSAGSGVRERIFKIQVDFEM